MPENLTGPLASEIPNVDPLESGIQFFEEQKKFTFLFRYQCNKVFLNHADSFNGRHILRYIGSREYVKPILFDELLGEVGSLPTLAEPASVHDTSRTGQSEELLTGEAHADEGSKHIIGKDADITETDHYAALLDHGEAGKDSSESILGGLLTAEQIACLKSLPNRLQKAQYLRSILNQVESVFDLPPEEYILEPTCYELAGTLKYCDDCLPEILHYLKERVRDIKSYLPTLLSCFTVIFDVSRDPSQIEEARWALRAIICSFEYLEKKSQLCFQKIQDVRKFILISSVMTWENTDKIKINKKPLSEEHLQDRKPHPLFKEHKHLEQEVIRAGLKYPDKFKTYVLASGITYGCEEDRLNYLFDLGWKNEEVLPLLGDGHNALPIIHIEDLAMIAFHCMTRVDTSPTYLLAVEKNPSSLLQITQTISKGLSRGKTHVYPIDEPLPLNINIHEDTYAMLTAELLLDPYIHKLNLPWKYHDNMINNMPSIIDEYIEFRNLCPFKIIVGGPPSCGKTNMAQRVADIYDVKYISAEEAVKSYIQMLEIEAEKNTKVHEEGRPDEGSNDAESAEDEDEGLEDVKGEEFIGGEEELGQSELHFANELEEIKHSMLVNGGMPDDNIVSRIMRRRLEEKDVLNHGYVLDGWPETEPQARIMFGKPEETEELPKPEMSEEDAEDEAEEEDDYGESGKIVEPKTRNVNILPNFFIQLEADCDDLLYKILLGKEDLERLQRSSIQLARRMDKYRDYEKTCCRAFDFFDNSCLEVKILRYRISNDPCPFLGKTLKHILDSLGPPTNIGFLKRYLDEYKIIRKAKEEEIMRRNMERADGVEKMDLEYFRAACELMDKWVDFKDNAIKEVSNGFNDEILPESIFNIAVKALMELKQASPDDHLEFLVEFLLKEYEKKKGKAVVAKETCESGLAFRRCVASVLENCDQHCLALLPQAVDVIIKYKRYAEAKGTKFPPQSCRDQADKKGSESECYDLPDDLSGKSQHSIQTEESTMSIPKNVSEMNLSKLMDLLIKTNPLWKESVSKSSKKLAMSDESLKLLLQQLRELSCEIRYRLKKRGVVEFDGDSSLGSCGIWPPETSEKECSGEIRTETFHQSSFDTKRNMENLIKDTVTRYSASNKSSDGSSHYLSENGPADETESASDNVVDKKPSIQSSDIL